jgi:hypothetical protein
MRLFRPFVRVVLFAACLLAAAPALAAGLFGGPPEPGQMPSRFVRMDGLDMGFVGTSGWPGYSGKLGKVTCKLGRVRFGMTVVESYAETDLGSGGAGQFLPVQVGYTLWSWPRKTWFFYGAVPDIYAEAGVGVLDLEFNFRTLLRMSVCCDVDYYGLGAGLEAGWLSIPFYIGGRQKHYSTFYFCVKARVLPFGIGF